jgi:hypothetical protein
MTGLSVADLLRERRYETAVIRMQDLCRIQDPEIPVDAAAVQAEFEARRQHLRSVVEPEPFRVTVTYVRSER